MAKKKDDLKKISSKKNSSKKNSSKKNSSKKISSKKTINKTGSTSSLVGVFSDKKSKAYKRKTNTNKKKVITNKKKLDKNKIHVLSNKKRAEVGLKQRLETKGRETLVSMRHVDISFGQGPSSLKVIDDFSLNIYKGEVLGLVGESGSGKSTIGKAIMGLVNRNSGSINLMGKEINSNSNRIKSGISDFIVKNVQMIFQNPANSLNPFKTIEKIISDSLDNINIFAAFIKTFDVYTITRLKKLLDGVEKPKVFNKITLDNVEKMIANEEYNEVENLIYTSTRNALVRIGTKKTELAVSFLGVRLKERQKFLLKKNIKVKKRKIKRWLIIDILSSVGLSENILKKFPLEFSGGQQQRIAISRAVILRPSLLIADEPISALDVSIQAQVINLFNELKKRFDLTIVFIAHDLRMIKHVSDRVAVMYKGTLVEIGDAKTIINNPIHPYTKSLLDAIPSINDKNKSLVSFQYNPLMHDYGKSDPLWIKINEGENVRFVRGTKNEVSHWMENDWSSMNAGDK